MPKSNGPERGGSTPPLDEFGHPMVKVLAPQDEAPLDEFGHPMVKVLVRNTLDRAA